MPAPSLRDAPLVLAVAAAAYGVAPQALVAHRRDPDADEARSVAILLLHDELGLTPTQIGAVLGRGHSTICTTRKRMRARVAADAALARMIDRLRRRLRVQAQVA